MKKIIWLVLIFAVMITACSNQNASTGSVQPSESAAEPSSEVEIKNKEQILASLGSEECIDWNTGISKLSAFGIKVEVTKLNVFNLDLDQLADSGSGCSQKTDYKIPEHFIVILET